MIGVGGNGGDGGGEDEALTGALDGKHHPKQGCRRDASCQGISQTWGREGERGFVGASEGGWVCACVCVCGGA